VSNTEDQNVMLTHAVENDVRLDRHTAHPSAKCRSKSIALWGVRDAVAALDDLIDESLRGARLVGCDIVADATNISRSEPA
jgi:hypothetical protein